MGNESRYTAGSHVTVALPTDASRNAINMSIYRYTSFQDSQAFANSDEGSKWISSQYVDATINKGYQDPHYIDLFETPEAAALAALVDWEDDGSSQFSVHAVILNGKIVYGADTGHNDGMTHTDRGGFTDFLRGEDWLDLEWIETVS